MLTMLKLLADVTESSVQPSNLPKGNTSSTELHTLLTTFFGIIGAIAVLVIVICGFQYITSAGDPQKTARARMGIIYALVGLAVAVGAEGFVAFVVNKL